MCSMYMHLYGLVPGSMRDPISRKEGSESSRNLTFSYCLCAWTDEDILIYTFTYLYTHIQKKEIKEK